MKIVNEQLKENMWRKRLKLKSQAKKQEKIKAEESSIKTGKD